MPRPKKEAVKEEVKPKSEFDIKREEIQLKLETIDRHIESTKQHLESAKVSVASLEKQIKDFDTSKFRLKRELGSIDYDEKRFDIIKRNVHDMGYEIPEDKIDKIWSKAWEDGHSYGFHEVEIHFQELVELFI